MYKECFLGYDCRNALSTRIDPKDHALLNPHARRVLAMDPTCWPSVVNQAGDITDPDFWSLPFPPEEKVRSPRGFWPELSDLKTYLNEQASAYQNVKLWIVAFTLVVTPDWKDGFKPEHDRQWPCLCDLESEPGSNDWTRLGYDIDGQSYFTGLSRPWLEEAQQMRGALWGPKLNENHLFSNSEDASQYAIWHMAKDPYNGDMLVFGLYLVEEYSPTRPIRE